MSKGVSILDKNISIVGSIFSNDYVDICGEVNGDVVVDELSVKENGRIFGNVYAREITLTKGSLIRGHIFVKKIKMLDGCEINGNIVYNILSMEDGAKIEGDVKYLEEKDILDKISERVNQVKLNNDKK